MLGLEMSIDMGMLLTLSEKKVKKLFFFFLRVKASYKVTDLEMASFFNLNSKSTDFLSLQFFLETNIKPVKLCFLSSCC